VTEQRVDGVDREVGLPRDGVDPRQLILVFHAHTCIAGDRQEPDGALPFLSRLRPAPEIGERQPEAAVRPRLPRRGANGSVVRDARGVGIRVCASDVSEMSVRLRECQRPFRSARVEDVRRESDQLAPLVVIEKPLQPAVRCDKGDE
jgi:hypothetical protein